MKQHPRFIKKVTLNDMLSLQEIGKQTFYEAFAAENTDEDMQKYLKDKFSIAALEAEIKNSNSQFYFIILETTIIGYLKINFGAAQTELRDDKSLEIERIYVLQKYHGQNAGQQLLEKAFEIAQQNSLEYIWLGVWEENHRAIRFYEKNGFKTFDKHTFKLGDDEQIDVLMRREL